jgi:hypothetical protein
VAKHTRDRDGGAEIAAQAEALREEILEVEKTLQVPDLRPGWGDAINEGARLWEKLAGLPAVVALGDYRPTDAAGSAFEDLKARIDPQIARFEALVTEDVSALNATMAAIELGAVLPLS